jgi:hypothetical protein
MIRPFNSRFPIVRLTSCKTIILILKLCGTALFIMTLSSADQGLYTRSENLVSVLMWLKITPAE